MKHKIALTWLVLTLIIVLAALACRLPLNLRGSTNRMESDPPDTAEEGLDASSTDLDIGLLEEMWDFSLPEMDGETIPLEMGASLFVPEGALPVGTVIDVQLSEVIPLLPEGFNQVGDALILTADAQPQTPVLLRMPIPAGVIDPTNLMIVRVEPDGTTTFLMTDVDGGDLVAFTPGFSKFCAVELVGLFMRDWKPILFGNPNLLPGQSGTFYLMNVHPHIIFNSQWALRGDAVIQHHDDQSVTITAGQTGGTVFLSYVGIDLKHGIRFYSSRMISIMSQELLERNKDSREGFRIAITSNKPKVFEGESLDVLISFHGHYRLPVLWSYELSRCHEKVDVISSNHQPIQLSFDCPVGNYEFYIFAEYLQTENVFIKTGSGHRFEVYTKPLMVQLVGPTELTLGDQNKTAVFTAEASGGIPRQGEAQNPLYDFSWRVLPGGEWVQYGLSELTITDQEFSFNQPGDYRVEVLVKNQDGHEARAILPVLVTGGEPLNAHILSWPDSINPVEPADMKFRIRGGTQILSGKKGSYTATVYWGDGSFDKIDPVAISEEGGAAFFTLTHSWQEPDTYTVMVFVEDPTGSIAYAEADISVREEILIYQGVVGVVSQPNDTHGLQIMVPESQVDLFISDNMVTANISMEYNFCTEYSVTSVPGRNPEEQADCYCTVVYEFVFTGQGPLTSPFSLEMSLDQFNFRREGPDCTKDSVPQQVNGTILTGTFFDDGSFSGTLDPEQYVFRFFGVFANKTEE